MEKASPSLSPMPHAEAGAAGLLAPHPGSSSSVEAWARRAQPLVRTPLQGGGGCGLTSAASGVELPRAEVGVVGLRRCHQSGAPLRRGSAQDQRNPWFELPYAEVWHRKITSGSLLSTSGEWVLENRK
jgi:hypothetical protein